MYNPNLHFHFTGIGGVGMSGIAEILINSGFRVSGSDLCDSDTCSRLRKLGAEVKIGHTPENLSDSVSLVVYSSAVRPDNPELVAAMGRGLPVIRRAEVLAELMRLRYGVAVAGSHGKTTTTSFIAAVLEKGGLDPTVVIGGQVRASEYGGKLGKKEFLVAETDESDRSFLLLKPTLAVVTNIDAEHLCAYDSFEDLERSFRQFVEAVPFYGLAVLCIDDPKVRDLFRSYRGRKVSYGLSPDAIIRAENVVQRRGSTSADVYRDGALLGRIELPMPGKHLLINSLAAVAIGIEFGIPIEVIREALGSFPGVKRRIEVLGVTSAGVTVITDYGHHPTEIRATLSAIRGGWGEDLGKLRVIFQPHRYTRTRDCFVDFLECFRDADELAISEIYSAGEEPIEGISAETLCNAITNPRPRKIEELCDVLPGLKSELRAGDVVLCLGAGSVGAFAEDLLREIS